MKNYFLALFFFLSISLQLDAIATTVCASGCDYTTIQTAVDAANPGDAIDVDYTATYTGASASILTLKYKAGCAGGTGAYIHIRSNNLAALPAGRPAYSDAANMPKLRVSGSPTQIIDVDQTTAGTGCYIIEGFHIATTGSQNVYSVIRTSRRGVGGTIYLTAPSEMTNHLIWRRNIIETPHSDTQESQNLCLEDDTNTMEVVDNLFASCYSVGQDAQAVAGYFATGFHYLRNNQISASGEGTIYGGSKPTMNGMRPNPWFIGNYYYRPWSWRVTSGSAVPTGLCMSDANGGESYNRTGANTWYLCVSSAWVLQGAGTSPQSVTNDKNQQEFKNQTQVISEGNIFQNGWYPTAGQQHGHCVLRNLSDSGDLDGTPDATNAYIVVRYNKCVDTPGWWTSGVQGEVHYYYDHDIDVHDNLTLNQGANPFSNNGDPLGDGVQVQVTGYQGRMDYSNNTHIMNPYPTSGMALNMGANIPQGITQFAYTGNITSWANYGYFAPGGSGNLWNSGGFLNWQSGNWYGNVIVNDQSCTNFSHPCPQLNTQSDLNGGGALNFQQPIMLCPFGCYYPAAWATVDMVNYQVDGTGDYNLKTSSPYYLRGPQRLSPGADIPTVELSTANAVSGVLNPYLDFQIHRLVIDSTTADLYFLAETTATATVTVGTDPDFVPASPEFTTTTAAGDRSRTVPIDSLAAHTLHYLIITDTATGHARKQTFWTK